MEEEVLRKTMNGYLVKAVKVAAALGFLSVILPIGEAIKFSRERRKPPTRKS